MRKPPVLLRALAHRAGVSLVFARDSSHFVSLAHGSGSERAPKKPRGQPVALASVLPADFRLTPRRRKEFTGVHAAFDPLRAAVGAAFDLKPEPSHKL